MIKQSERGSMRICRASKPPSIPGNMARKQQKRQSYRILLLAALKQRPSRKTQPNRMIDCGPDEASPDAGNDVDRQSKNAV
jgi:hypothetical protein